MRRQVKQVLDPGGGLVNICASCTSAGSIRIVMPSPFYNADQQRIKERERE